VNKVREFREKAGISQVELAWRVRIACTNLSAIERGTVMPWPKVRKALTQALGVAEAELFPDREKAAIQS
jgi:transcriptional regulator with XRE-family HTH domain